MIASSPDSRARTTRLEELAGVAHLHFVDGLDQRQVAARVHLSPSTISRMLKEAVAVGVVQITVNHPFPRDSEQEESLIRRFGVDEAWVLAEERLGIDEDADAVGALGARCIEGHLSRDSTLAVCWGHTTRKVIEKLRPMMRSGIEVVQMIGSVGTSDADIDGNALTRLAGERLGGSWTLLHAPLVVDDADFAAELVRQSAIVRVLARAAAADCALVGLGSIDPSSSALLRAGFVSESELEDARARGAVGDVCGKLIDADGRPVQSTFSDRIVGLSLRRLAQVPHVVGVAYGEEKVDIIRAALAGKHLRAIVTDYATASLL